MLNSTIEGDGSLVDVVCVLNKIEKKPTPDKQ